jgi:biotin carboxyl carrier protein
MAKMKFVAHLRGEQHEIIVDSLDKNDGKYIMTLDNVAYEVDAHVLRSEIVSILIDHQSYDVEVERTGNDQNTLDGRTASRVRGRVIRFEMLDERREKMKEAAGLSLGLGGKSVIESPMPGKILRFLVEEGETVEEGQGVVVIEAMKMENKLTAPNSGIVQNLYGAIGDTIETGAVLARIE